MPPRDPDLGLAHPQAADWMFGALGPADTRRFGEHLESCEDCRAAVAEFGPVAGMLGRVRWPVYKIIP